MAFKILVDWDNDDNFTGTYDDISGDVKDAKWFVGFKAPLQLVADESTLKLILNNPDGKYLPENTSSPIYGKVKKYRPVKVVWDPGGVETVQWRGFTEGIQINWSAGVNLDEVMIECRGGKQLLESRSVNVPEFTDVTADVIIQNALNQANAYLLVQNIWSIGIPGSTEIGVSTFLGTPSNFQSLQTGVYTIPYYGGVLVDNALEVIGDAVQAERGRFFFAKDGTAILWNESHLRNDTTVDATVDTQAGDYRPRSLGYETDTLVYNIITVETTPRTTDASETLYTHEDVPLTIATSDSVQFRARLRKSDGRFASASSLTANATFSSGTATVTVDASGGTANVTITNESASTVAVLSALTLDGVASVQQNGFSVEVVDGTSITEHGRHERRISMGPGLELSRIQEVADYELSVHKDGRSDVRRIEFIRNPDGLDNDFMIDWSIGARLRVISTELGHDSEYFVMGMEHRLGPHAGSVGEKHSVVYHLEPAAVHIGS